MALDAFEMEGMEYGPDYGFLSLDELIEIVREAYWDDERDFDDEFGDSPIEALWEERKTLVGLLAAVKRTKDGLDREIAAKLGPGSTVRLDDYQVKVAPDRRLVCVDPEGLLSWLGNDWGEALNVRGAQWRQTALREIAKRREEDPDSAIDSYFEWNEGEARLRTVPIERAPKYVQNLEHGEVKKPR